MRDGVTTVETSRGRIPWRPARWVVPFFAAAATLLVPWIIILATRLPSSHSSLHWDVTWVGFDVFLSLLLVAVALAAWRGSAWIEGAATAAAAMLLADAWFDLTTSASRLELYSAIAAAVLVELPLAVLCLLLARDAERVTRRLLNRGARASDD